MARHADLYAQATILAYQARQKTLRNRVRAVLQQSWAGMGAWNRPEVEGFARRTVPVVLGSQKVMSALTVGYLNQLRSAAVHRVVPIHVPPAEVTGPDLRGGLDPLEEWTRPGQTVWYQLSQGAELAAAVALGRDRAMAMAETDLQLAKTWTSRAFVGRDSFANGYERVPDGSACDYCLGVAADGVVYHTDALMPIHPHCGCDVAPVYQTQTLPTDVLGAQDPPPAALPYAVETDGEIGPVLVGAGQHFRDAAEVAADTND